MLFWYILPGYLLFIYSIFEPFAESGKQTSKQRQLITHKFGTFVSSACRESLYWHVQLPHPPTKLYNANFKVIVTIKQMSNKIRNQIRKKLKINRSQIKPCSILQSRQHFASHVKIIVRTKQSGRIVNWS